MTKPEDPHNTEHGRSASDVAHERGVSAPQISDQFKSPVLADAQSVAARTGLLARGSLKFQNLITWPSDQLQLAWAIETHHRAAFNWMPVGLVMGVLLYFSLPYEPSLAMLVGLLLLLSGLIWRFRHDYGRFLLLGLAAQITAGASLVAWETQSKTFVMLEAEMRTEISGVVVSLTSREGRTRLRLTDIQTGSDGLVETAMGDVLISVRDSQIGDVHLGERVSGDVTLQPFSSPLVPGGYDFRRNAFFDGLSARGFAVGPVVPELFGSTRQDAGQRVAQHLRALRMVMSNRIQLSLPGESGALAAALLVGDRSGISEDTQTALRASGLAHILAISGLHMALVTATLFGTIRLIAALFPLASARWPIKKIAAAVALVGALIYLGLSGGAVSAQRAFIMAGIFLLAILFDRSALTMRNVAIAAVIIILSHPAAVLSPGFQMSFMAVLALVAIYQRGGVYSRIRRHLQERKGPLITGALAVFSLMLTSIVAGIATWPFSIHHFYQAASYGVIGNLAAMPIVALLVMPMGVLALLLLPLGLEVIPLTVMGLGIEGVVFTAQWVAGLEGALHRPGQISAVATLMAAFGIIALCLGQTRLRFFVTGLFLTAALLIGLHQSQKPLILIDGRARLIAVTGHDGLSFYGNSRDEFLTRIWLGSVGDGADPGAVLTTARRSPNCDRQGCLVTVTLSDTQTVRVALVHTEEGLFETCLNPPDIIVTRLAKAPSCNADTTVLITKDMLRDTGSLALYATGAQGSHNRSEALSLAHLGLSIRRARPMQPRRWQ